MSFANQQFPAGQEAKAGSVARWRLRRVAYLGAALLCVTVAGYAVKEMRPRANAALYRLALTHGPLPSKTGIAIKFTQPGGVDVVECNGSVTVERAEDFDPNNPKFKNTIINTTCTGGGVASAAGGGFSSFPNNGSCTQIEGVWAGTLRWKNSAGRMIGTSDVEGRIVLESTGAGGTTIAAVTGSVTGGDKFVGATATAAAASAGTGLTCVLVGDIVGGDASGSGALAP